MVRLTLPVDVLLIVLLTGSYVASNQAVLSWTGKATAVLLAMFYLVVHLLSEGDGSGVGDDSRRGRRFDYYKLTIVLALVLLLILGPSSLIMSARHSTSDPNLAHDGLVQVEEAIKFLLDGQNPYVATYEDTPLAQVPWGLAESMPNPALYNFAYLPFVFLAGVPLFLLSRSTIGWYDQRLLYFAAFAIALLVLWKLSKDRIHGLIALIVVGLSPLTVPYLVEGRNDILIVALFGLSFYALSHINWRWRFEASGALFGVACATKQVAWFFFPYYLLYVWGHWQSSQTSRTPFGDWREVGRRWLAPMILTAVVLILPFFLWNPAAFLEDTVFYISGTSVHNYPIRAEGAYGFHVLLASPEFWGTLDTVTSGPLGFLRPLADGMKVRSATQYFPFWILQALFALPVLLWSLLRQRRNNNLTIALSGYSIGLFVYSYFSRFFHDNYIGYLITMLAVAYLIQEPMARPDLASQSTPECHGEEAIMQAKPASA